MTEPTVNEIKIATFNVEWMVNLFQKNKPNLLTRPRPRTRFGSWPKDPQLCDDEMAIATPSAANHWAALGNGSDAASWFMRQDRPHSEVKEIAAVAGNTVTFTSPLQSGKGL